MANKLTYLDFATDEVMYLMTAYTQGLRYNAMVSQAQRICECYLKHLITKNMFNAGDVMMSHNLRELYSYIENSGIDISAIRQDIMLLNNYYTHTRYPGREAFMAGETDITCAVEAVGRIAKIIARHF